MEKLKIGIIFRGGIVPDFKSVEINVRCLKESFEDYKISTFLVTWDSEVIPEVLSEKKFDNTLILKPITEEEELPFINRKITEKTQPLIFRNVYKQFYSQKAGLSLIKEFDEFDYVISSRTDLYVKIKNPEDWLIQSTYVMPNVHCFFEYNDQFGVSDPQTMYNAWNFENKSNLVDLFQNSFNPEDCLGKIIHSNKINVTYKSPHKYELNRRRHEKLPSYKEEVEYIKRLKKEKYKAILLSPYRKLVLLKNKIIR